MSEVDGGGRGEGEKRWLRVNIGYCTQMYDLFLCLCSSLDYYFFPSCQYNFFCQGLKSGMIFKICVVIKSKLSVYLKGMYYTYYITNNNIILLKLLYCKYIFLSRSNWSLEFE